MPTRFPPPSTHSHALAHTLVQRRQRLVSSSFPPPPSGGDLAGTPASTATGLSGGAIAGITIGAVAAVAAIAGGVTYAMRRREEGVEGVVKV